MLWSCRPTDKVSNDSSPLIATKLETSIPIHFLPSHTVNAFTGVHKEPCEEGVSGVYFAIKHIPAFTALQLPIQVFPTAHPFNSPEL